VRHPYVALDTETTGLEAGRDEIIEVAAIRFQGSEVLGTWNTLVKPTTPIPEAITRLTGITPADVERAPLFYTILPELARFIGDDPIVGHSIGFDLEFLAAQGLPLNNASVDTYELSTLLLPELPDRTLVTVARGLGIEYPEAHRALADAQVAMEAFVAFWERLLSLEIDVLEEIVRLAGKTDWPLRAFFEEALQEAGRTGFGRRRPSGLPLALRLVPPEPRPDPPEPTSDERPLDVEMLAGLLEPEGLFGQAFPQYEHRPQQIEMLRGVTQTFNHGGQLIVEAGTGTGKSIAYLIPAVALAIRRGQPVIISTNTINLQDQLFHKDIPDVRRVLSQAGPGNGTLAEMAGFRAALLKGRNNYLCLRRWEGLRRDPTPSLDQVRTLVKTLLWLPHTQTGDRAELVLARKEYGVWRDLSSNTVACRGADCPYQQQDRCLFYRARRRAEAAHVIVVNHSLLLANVAMENRILPPHHHVIVDEAHHLEGVATDQLGFSVTAEEIRAHLAAICRPVGPGHEEGLLALLPVYFRGEKIPDAARQTLQTLRREIRNSVEAAQAASQTFFSALSGFVRDREEQAGPSYYDRHIRITSSVRIQPDWSDIEIAWENVSVELLRVYERIGRLSTLCHQRAEIVPDDSEFEDVLLEISLLGQRTGEIQDQVTAIVSQGHNNGIFWITIEAQGDTIGLHTAPLHVGDLLHQGLYQHKDALVLTSATLSTEGHTTFLRERLGLPEADELLLDSPFDYPSAALLVIPEDIPDPRDSQYGRALAKTLINTCQASKGRALILFTSHRALRQTYTAIRRPLERDGIAVLGQGIDGSRHVLLDKFRRNPHSVLLGTSSFWEGIDVVGKALSVLVITKLPFTVPSDPVFAARCELFEEPFFQFAVPKTVLRFKQGFGRLIRSQTDRGVAVLLDGRVLTRSYGHTFLDSLPPATIRRVRLLAIPQMVRDWLRGETAGQSQ
jgi:DNA polymerase-3 subunit epsilon/ATP-dependent DNA helicase DinG